MSYKSSLPRVADVQRDVTFTAFLASEFIPEYAEFTEALAEYKATPSESKRDAILNTFVVADAPRELNLTFEVRRRASDADKPLERVFDELEEAVLNLLQHDVLPRYLKSVFAFARMRRDFVFPECVFDEFIRFCDYDEKTWLELPLEDGCRRWVAEYETKTKSHALKCRKVCPETDAHLMIELLSSVENFSRYDTNIIKARVLKQFSPDFSICFYVGQSNTLLVRKREFCVGRCVKQLNPHTWVCVSRSIDHEDVTWHPKRIKGVVECSGWLVRQLESGTEVTYVNRVSYGGRVPARVANRIARERTAHIVNKVCEIATNKLTTML